MKNTKVVRTVSQMRKSDINELANPVGTFDLGCFAKMGRSIHAGHVHHHVVTDGLPDHGADHRRRPALGSQKLNIDPSIRVRAFQSIDEALIWCESRKTAASPHRGY